MKETNSKPTIEVEIRSLFDQQKYGQLKAFLDVNAEDLGQDDKDVYFFLHPQKVVKTVHNVSQQSAKIVLKTTRVGKGGHDTEEVEISIAPTDFESATRIFKALAFEQVQHSFQQRRNYMYKGVEIALKYSESWGYHIELEKMINDKTEQAKAEKLLHAIAEELGIKPMSPEEQKEVAAQIDKSYT